MRIVVPFNASKTVSCEAAIVHNTIKTTTRESRSGRMKKQQQPSCDRKKNEHAKEF
jgi:hypothetical protein